jgi:hypothetical protein
MAKDTIFGKCQVCGNDGGEPAQADIEAPDAGTGITADGDNTDVRTVANDYRVDSVGSGVILMYYKGRLMCEVCKNRLSSDEESIISAQKHADSERFRQSVGFKRSV